MSCSRRPKGNPIPVSDSKPQKTNSIFQLSSKNGSIKSNTKQPKKEINKLFASVTLGGLGCGGPSSAPVSAPAAIRLAAEWETKKKKKMKKKKKKKKKIGSNICCPPPGIGFAHDVVPLVRVNPPRSNHRERSCAAPRRNVDLEHISALTSRVLTVDTSDDVSDARQFRRFTRTSHQSLPEMMILQHNLFERRIDQFGEWRLNVDTMSYEELLDLGDKIGYVGTGLKEDKIMRSLVKTNNSDSESVPLLIFRDKDWKCSICQGGCKEDGDLGRLICGHYHHINCIKQWLLHKNACPICKTAAVFDKKG